MFNKMFNNFFVLIIFLLVQIQSNAQIYTNGTFDDFISYYKLEINPTEYEYRKNLYLTEQKRIINHNNVNKGWIEGLYPTSILTKSEKRKYYGYSKTTNQYKNSLYTTVYIDSNILNLLNLIIYQNLLIGEIKVLLQL